MRKIFQSIRSTLPKGLKTSWWLIKITIPVSFGVLLLSYSGFLDKLAVYTGPLFNLIGLPGKAAIVLVTSIFTNIYSVVAVLTTLNMPVREGIIIGTMCLVSHNFIIETAVLSKTGSSAGRMILLRLIISLLIGWMLNLIMPGHTTTILTEQHLVREDFSQTFVAWLQSMSVTTLKILILVNVLLILQRLMEDFDLIKWLEKPMIPLLKLMGLPSSTTFSWIVANAIGLAYGSAIMIDQVEKGRMKRDDADLLNHHIAVSHSQLEDPLLFLAIGYTIHWMIWPRVILAMAVVWIRRAEIRFRKKEVVENA